MEAYFISVLNRSGRSSNRLFLLCVFMVGYVFIGSATPEDWRYEKSKGQLSEWNFFGQSTGETPFFLLQSNALAFSCKPQVNISLNQEGFALITGVMLVNSPEYPADQYVVDIMGPLTDTVTCANIGEELFAVVTELPTGNSCMSMLNIEDKLPPLLVCTPDTLPCNTDIPSIDFESYLESVSDNCDPTPTYWYSIVVQDLMCHPDGLTHRILVTWTATDVYGNSATCVDTIYLRKPTLEEIDFPDDVTISCDDPNINTDPSNTGEPTFEGEPIGFACQLITFTGDVVIPMCDPTYKIRRTWTIMDWCSGLQVTHVQEILIVDNNDPIITCPADITLGTDFDLCTTKYTLPLPVLLSDACADSVAIDILITVLAVPPIPGFFAPGQMINLGVGTTLITMRATDPCGNSSTCQYSVTVEDDTPPDIICPEDLTIDCDASTDPGTTGFAIAIDDCDSNPVVTYEDVTVSTSGCAVGFVLTRTWTAEDDSGNTTTCIQTIVLTDNSPPVINCPDDITISCEESTDPGNTGIASATDGCDNSPAISYSDVTIEATCPHKHIINRTWIATDECGHSSTCLQVIYLDDIISPAIECPVDLTLECTSPIPTDLATATDNCSTGLTITFSDIMCDNPVMGFTGLYDISLWTTIIPAEGGSVTVMGDSEVMLISPDITLSCDDASVQFSINITSTGQIVFDWHYETLDTDGPNFDPFGYNLNGTFYQLTDDNGNDIQSGTATVAVTAGDVFALEQQSSDCVFGAGATTVVEFFACIEQDDEVCTQLIIRTHTATDECNNLSSCVQTIFFEDTVAPEITCVADVIVECDESTDPSNTGLSTATDFCDPTPDISYSDVTIASQICVQEYTIERTWTATDNCGNTTTCLQVITVDDSTPPELTCAANVTIECTESVSPDNTGVSTATDNCDSAPIVDYSDITLAGTCPQAYTITRTWVASDVCGNTSTCNQILTIVDSTPPSITCLVDVTIECDESTAPENTGFAIASDLCDNNPDLTYSDIVIDGACPQAYTIIRIWTASDGCGNSSTCEQMIIVVDTTVPTITFCPSNVTIECDESTSPDNTGIASATDNCDSAPSVTYSDTVNQGGCPQGMVIIRVWLATDACGNQNACTQIIVVEDSTPPSITCPTDITIECDDNSLPGNTGMAIATDNCDSTPEVTYNDQVVIGTCPQEYTLLRTWMATDACQNSSTCLQIISLQDNTPPVMICPSDVTIECTESVSPDNTGVSTATDNCDSAPIVDYNDVTLAGVCPQAYSIIRTWIGTDICGNTSTCNQIITIVDSTPPSITCPVDVTIECDESTAPENTGFATAIDLCSSDPDITYNDLITAGTCPQAYTITRVWTASDGCGNSSTCLQIIILEDNTPPVLTCVPDVTINCTDSTDPVDIGNASAVDACDSSPIITFNDTVSPGGCSGDGGIIRTWTATDGCGNSSTCIQVISIADDIPPTITFCPDDVTIECDESSLPGNTGLALATDNCSADPVVTYTDLSFPGNCPQEYTIERTWTAEDDCGNVGSCVQVISVIDETAPVIETAAMDITVECDGSGNQTELEEWLAGNGGAIATDACGTPAGNVMTGVLENSDLQWMYYYNTVPTPYVVYDLGSFTVTVDGDYDVSQVVNVNSGAPIVLSVYYFPSFDPNEELFNQNPIDLQSGTVDYTLTLAAGTYDLLVHQSLFFPDPPQFNADYQITITPAAGNSGTATFGNVTWTNDFNGLSDDCGETGSALVTFTATDGCGNTSTTTATFTIEDTVAPEVFCPASLTIECDESTLPDNTGMASSTDQCDASPVITYDDVITSDPEACPSEYTITRTWTATDACGNSSTCVQVITVDDSTVPTITFCPPSVTIECDESTTPASLGTATATDNCDDAPIVVFNDATVPGNCPQEMVITRTWTATDACGNNTNCIQVITVEDNTAPTISCPTDVTIECDQDTLPANTGMATATDNCDPAPTVTYSDGIEPGSCPQEMFIYRTWTTTDACGNSTNCVQVITVEDSTAPDLTCPADVTIDCDDDTSTDVNGFASATDNCASQVSVDYSDVTFEGSCGSNYTITRTWIAIDDCGNTSTCAQIISIEDNTPPICATQDITITEVIEPGTNVILITAEMIDNESYDECGGMVTISVTPDSLSCDNEGPNIVVLTVMDECGNSSTCTAIVTIDCIDPCVQVVGWVYLAGAASDPTGQPNYSVPMRTTLNDLQVLPGQSFFDPFFGVKYTPPGQPYSGEPWFYPGMEGDLFDSGGDPMMGDAGYPPTVVDWVLVSLRTDSAGIGGPVCQAAALLHNDGHIEFVEEFDCCNLDLYASYFLVIEHRNHLIVMSHDSLPIDIDNSTITYDFRIQQSYLDDPFMFGASAQIEIQPGIYAMLGANGDQSSSGNADTDINFSDRIQWQMDNGAVGEYLIGDYNLNGDTNFNDRIMWERFNDKFTSVPRD